VKNGIASAISKRLNVSFEETQPQHQLRAGGQELGIKS